MCKIFFFCKCDTAYIFNLLITNGYFYMGHFPFWIVTTAVDFSSADFYTIGTLLRNMYLKRSLCIHIFPTNMLQLAAWQHFIYVYIRLPGVKCRCREPAFYPRAPFLQTNFGCSIRMLIQRYARATSTDPVNCTRHANLHFLTWVTLIMNCI
ncbi:hypothetical protein D3C85_973510 [compost metagenome]